MFFSETIKTEDDINVHWIPINQIYVFMEISNVRCSPPQDQNSIKKIREYGIIDPGMVLLL